MEKLEREMLDNIEDPKELEALYRKNPDKFTSIFDKIFALNPESLVLQVWKERLHYSPVNETVVKYDKKKVRDIFFIVFLSLLAGSMAKLFFELVEREMINPANIVFAVLPVLSIYFIIQNKLSKKLSYIVLLLFLGTLIYLNFLPLDFSDSIVLANLHLPFFLWTLLGVSFIGDDINSLQKRMDYLRYNGEVLIYSALILIGGIVLTFITLGLFFVLGIDVVDFYIGTIVIYGIAATPIVSTYLAKTRSQVGSNIAPIIAKIFSPLMLLTLIIYLLTIVVFQKNPYSDRTFLLVLNVMLLAVLALTIYVISERRSNLLKSFNDYIIALLVLVALIIDTIALTSIVFRLASFGITPNRIALLGINILVFGNLVLIGLKYISFLRGKGDIYSVEEVITRYLPIYSLWTIIVTFGFPLLFNFK